MRSSRRDWLFTATKLAGACGLLGAAWPFLRSMGPTADTLVLAPEPVWLGDLRAGEERRLSLDIGPCILRHLTQAQVATVRQTALEELSDRYARNANLAPNAPPTVGNRLISIEKPIVLLSAVCPRLGCIVFEGGDFGGWFCSCGGAHFDAVGRIRKGPSPNNLRIPAASMQDEMLYVPRPMR